MSRQLNFVSGELCCRQHQTAALNLLMTHVDNIMASCVKGLRGGVFYDLRSRHPTVDGVGLLNDFDSLAGFHTNLCQHMMNTSLSYQTCSLCQAKNLKN